MIRGGGGIQPNDNSTIQVNAEHAPGPISDSTESLDGRAAKIILFKNLAPDRVIQLLCDDFHHRRSDGSIHLQERLSCRCRITAMNQGKKVNGGGHKNAESSSEFPPPRSLREAGETSAS